MSKSRNKPRLCIALFHRDKYSLDKNLGLAIYHWAILIRPKNIKHLCSSECYDVTDADITREWRFRVRKPFDIISDARFLGAVVIGKLPKDAEIESLLKELPLPVLPEQNCVTWTQDALKMLKGRGCVDTKFEASDVVEEAMKLGNEVMSNGRPEVVEGMFKFFI